MCWTAFLSPAWRIFIIVAIVVFRTGDGWGMQGGAPNGLGGGANSGMSGPPMGGNNQGNQGNMGGKTTTQVTIPKDVSKFSSKLSLWVQNFLFKEK